MQMGGILVVNSTSSPGSVFVSKYSNSKGDDSWYTLAAGARDTWDRSNWELVAFKNSGDTDRAGVYVRTNTTVTFHSLANITTS